MGCPCKEGRYGAFGLVVSVYWAMQCGGVAAMLNLVSAGAGMGIWWAIWTGCAVLLLIEGIRQALSHDDNFDGQSVAVSVGLIGLALWALAHHWFWIGPEWTTHISRVVWPGLIASEVFNLWLNFRGRRHAAPVAPVVRDEPRRLRRRRSIEWVEEIEGHGVGADDLARHHLGSNTHFPEIDHHGEAPQIVYVKDREGNFIPVQAPGSVPVSRRLR
jgi:hypothetical protein